MKGNKKVLVAIVLLLIATVSFTTYAIYRSETTAQGSLKAAAWSVKVGSTDIESANVTFGINDITWTTHTGKNDTIAPGDTGTITLAIDATGSEVDVIVEAEIDEDNAVIPDGMTVTQTSGTNGKQEIAYNASSMTTNVVLTVTWPGDIDDPTSKDTTDKAKQGSTLTIPVKLKARQKLASDN